MRHNLSEVTDLIRDRRSLSPEKFSERKVHREIVELALTNATWAPTHGMTQPWRFTAYVNEGMQAIGPKLASWYKTAAGEAFSPTKFEKLDRRGKRVSALVVIGMVPDPAGRISEQDEMLAVACAVQNMYLTCTAHGIGGFWSTPSMIHLDEVRAFAGLPEDGRVLGFFYMGYPEEGWPKSHRKPLEYVTQWVDQAPV
jgi:nitroreductase